MFLRITDNLVKRNITSLTQNEAYEILYKPQPIFGNGFICRKRRTLQSSRTFTLCIEDSQNVGHKKSSLVTLYGADQTVDDKYRVKFQQ